MINIKQIREIMHYFILDGLYRLVTWRLKFSFIYAWNSDTLFSVAEIYVYRYLNFTPPAVSCSILIFGADTLPQIYIRHLYPPTSNWSSVMILLLFIIASNIYFFYSYLHIYWYHFWKWTFGFMYQTFIWHLYFCGDHWHGHTNAYISLVTGLLRPHNNNYLVLWWYLQYSCSLIEKYNDIRSGELS